MPWLNVGQNPERDAMRVLKGFGAGLSVGQIATMMDVHQRKVSDLLRWYRKNAQLEDVSLTGLVVSAFRRGALDKHDVPRPDESFTLQTKAERDLLTIDPTTAANEPLRSGVLTAKDRSQMIGDITLTHGDLRTIFGVMAGWEAKTMAEQTNNNRRTFERNTRHVLETLGLVTVPQLATFVERDYGSDKLFQLPRPALLTPMSEFNTTVDEVTLHIDRPAYVKHPSLEAVDLTLLPIEPK